MTAGGATPKTVAVLSGGVGGAKLVLGMSREISAERLLVVANTADDFKHLGFHISPDIDTLIYTLANLANNEHGWGRANESWSFMEALEVLGGDLFGFLPELLVDGQSSGLLSDREDGAAGEDHRPGPQAGADHEGDEPAFADNRNCRVLRSWWIQCTGLDHRHRRHDRLSQSGSAHLDSTKQP